MQRSFIFTGGDFGVSLLGLRDSDVVEEGHHAVQLAVVFVQAVEIHLGKVDGGHLPGFEEMGELD